MTPQRLTRFAQLWADPSVEVGAIAAHRGGVTRATCYEWARKLGLPNRRRTARDPAAQHAIEHCPLDEALARLKRGESRHRVAQSYGVPNKWLRLRAQEAGILPRGHRNPLPEPEAPLLPDGVRVRCQRRDIWGEQCYGLYPMGGRCPHSHAT